MTAVVRWRVPVAFTHARASDCVSAARVRVGVGAGVAAGKWVTDSYYKDADGNLWDAVMEGGAWSATSSARPGVRVTASVAEGARVALGPRIDALVAASPWTPELVTGSGSGTVPLLVGLAAAVVVAVMVFR